MQVNYNLIWKMTSQIIHKRFSNTQITLLKWKKITHTHKPIKNLKIFLIITYNKAKNLTKHVKKEKLKCGQKTKMTFSTNSTAITQIIGIK